MQEEKITENEAAPKHPIVEQARRPMSIEFSLRVEVDKDGNFELFGQPSFICPDHSTSIRLIQSCFLDQLSASIDGFATMPDEKLSEGARKLKRRILNTAWITYPPAPAPGSLDAALTEGVTCIVDKSSIAEPPDPAPCQPISGEDAICPGPIMERCTGCYHRLVHAARSACGPSGICPGCQPAPAPAPNCACGHRKDEHHEETDEFYAACSDPDCDCEGYKPAPAPAPKEE